MRILSVLFLSLLAASCVGDGNDSKNDIKVGDRVPAFEIENDIVGGWNGFRSPEDFIGEKSLIFLFTTTCPHCRHEAPYVEYAYGRLSAEGLQVVPIGRGATCETLESYWDSDIPRYPDPDRKVFDRFADQGVPRFYLVDEKGVVVWMHAGELGYGDFDSDEGDEFNEMIKEKLNL